MMSTALLTRLLHVPPYTLCNILPKLHLVLRNCFQFLAMENDLLQEMDQTMLNSGKNTVDKERLEELVRGEKIVKITSCDAVVFNGHVVIQKLAPPSSSTTNVTFQERRHVL